MNKKKLFALSLAVIMVAILSFSSLAWFTDDDTATNDFNIGGAGTGNEDDVFSMDVKEKGEDGAPVDDMTFEKVLPGDHYKKEAYITNTGAYEQYIRVIVTVTDWAAIKENVSVNMDDDFATNWTLNGASVGVNADGNLVQYLDSAVDANGDLVVVMFLNRKLQPGETVDIMDYVSVSSSADQDDFTATGLADGFQVKIKADAAQTENILSEYSANEWQNAKKTFETLGV